MIIENVEIYFAKLVKPNNRFNKENPTWEIQIRTAEKKQADEWKASGLTVKPVIPDDGAPFFRVNLKKKSIGKDGPATPVRVVDGKLNDINPDTIGNGSVGNIRVFQYNYTNNGVAGTASVLMAIQLTKYVVYTPPVRDDEFEETSTERVMQETQTNDEDF